MKTTETSTPASALPIQADTRVFDILERYGDIAPVMEAFGIKRVGRWSLRRMITRVLTVERAAKIHRVPLDEFLSTLRAAVATVDTSEATR